jgi:hypothetical protein
VFERWRPQAEALPLYPWWDYPLRLSKLADLLDTTTLPQPLFERLLWIGRYIQALETQLHDDLGTRSAEPERLHAARAERVLRWFYVMDLYLKQLAHYVTCEARRQGFSRVAQGAEQAGLLRPLPWPTVLPDGQPPERLATWLETELLDGYLPGRREPTHADYRRASLRELIQLAQRR